MTETVPYLPAGYGPKLAVTWVPYLRDWADGIDRQRRFGGRVPIGKRFIISATIRLVADKIERAASNDASHSVTDASGTPNTSAGAERQGEGRNAPAGPTP